MIPCGEVTLANLYESAWRRFPSARRLPLCQDLAGRADQKIHLVRLGGFHCSVRQAVPCGLRATEGPYEGLVDDGRTRRNVHDLWGRHWRD